MARFNFTKAKLSALKPAASRAYHQDARTEGLSICVLPSGERVFYVVKWHDGRKVRLRLGSYPGVSVEQARRECQKAVAKMAEGIDPQAAKQAARREDTIGGAFDFWLENAKARGVKTWGEDEKRYKRFLKGWTTRRLSTIKKSDVQSLFASVTKDNGRYAANRLLGLLKAVFHRAADMGFTGPDPTAGVKKHREEKRDRFLHAGELQGFFAALFGEPNITLRDVLLVALLTGARKGNVMAMRWSDIDFAASLWRIPATKSGKPVVVPLVPPAVALLQARRAAGGMSSWVFPSNRAKSGHISDIKAAWKRVKTAASLLDCRPHDLRRSLASHMAIGGTSLPIVGAMLGHSQPSTTAIYARLSTDPIRAAAVSAATSMLAHAGASINGDGMTIIDIEASADAE